MRKARAACCPLEVFGFVLEMLQTTLRDPDNDVDAKFFTREVLEGKGKTPGWVQMTMCKYPVARQVLTLVANVPNTSNTVQVSKESLMNALGSPRKYSDAFHRPSQELAEIVDADATPVADGLSFEPSDLDMEQLTAAMPKCFAKFAEILKGLYAGQYDEEMTALAGEKSPKDTTMDDAALSGVSPKLQQALREALRLMSTHTNQFTACDGPQEVVSVRSLKRDASNPDDAEVAAAGKERALLWERARDQRRKYVALSHLHAPTRTKIEAAVAKVPKGRDRSTHRLFVWSADLVTESNATPWKEASPAKTSGSDAVLDFMSKLAGPGDFGICFDGRMRSERSGLEKKLVAGGKSTEELFVLYAADGLSSAGNKVFLGARLHEIAYVIMPCRKQRVTVAERKDKFLPRGADSTHCPTFANVPLPSVTCLPRISPQEKAVVFPVGSSGEPAKAACPQKWDFGGVPMYWRESKPLELWIAILKMFNAKVIVDFTPGSGALAAAAMSQGAKYTGFVEEAKHLSWLQNIVDTAALRYIAQQGEVLYMEDLAELVHQHYQDLLDNADAEEKPDLEWLSSDEEEQ